MSQPCKKCALSFEGNFCPHCGFPAKLRRIDGKYILEELSAVINFDKGILYTVKALLLRPGPTVREFIREDRNRLVKPIVFIIICSLIYSLFQQLFHFEDGYVATSMEEESSSLSIFNWISQNYGYSNIIMGIFISFWLKIFFKKYAYNFYEILLLLCFIMGMGMLFFALFGVLDSLIDLPIADKGYFLGIVYIIWAIAQFFDPQKWINYPKALLAYFLGVLSFVLGALLLGFLMEYTG
jgi:hypothetical protein